MKKFRKELLPGFLIVMLGLIALLPVGKVEAASGDNWTMDSSTGTLTITGDGFSIKSTTLSSFKDDVPVSLTSLGSQSFKGCEGLDIVVLNPDVSIGTSYYETFGSTTTANTIHCYEYSTAHVYANARSLENIHFLKAGVTTEKATTTSYGEMQYTCVTCGNTYIQEIQPLELDVSNVTSVTVSGSGFKVKWSKVSGASGYKLYRKTASGDYVLAKKTSSTSYTDSGFTAGTKYTYVVKAYNSVQTADEGTSMSYTFIKKTTISSLTSTSKGVKIKWKAVSGAKKYVIYRNGTEVTTTSSTSYVDTGATTNGKAYKYYILTYVDSSSYSKSAVKKTYYLKTQAISSAVNKSGKKIQVKYSKNNRATGYQIQYSTSSKFTSSKTTTKKVTSYKTVSKTLTKLTKNKTYYVRVRSYKKVSDTVYYGAWSAKKKVKVTK